MNMDRNALAPRHARAALIAPPGPRKARSEQQNLAGWLFALPWTVIFLVFMAVPILVSFVLSFTDFDIANLQNPFNLHFIGIQNYTKLLQDQTFLLSALNTVII